MFILYVVSNLRVSVQGLDAHQNIYNFPEAFIGMTESRPHGWMTLEQCDFEIHFSPEVVEGDAVLAELFRSRHQVNLCYPEGFPHCSTTEYQKAMKPWRELMRNPDSPFKWEFRRDSKQYMDAVAVNDIALAHRAIAWWDAVVKQFQLDKEIQALQSQIYRLEKQKEDVCIPSLLDLQEEEEYEYA